MTACDRSIHKALQGSANEVKDHQNHDGTHHGHPKTLEVEPGHSMRPEMAEEPTAHHRADNSQDDVEEKALARLVDDLASNEPRDQTENDPCKESHAILPPLVECEPEVPFADLDRPITYARAPLNAIAIADSPVEPPVSVRDST